MNEVAEDNLELNFETAFRSFLTDVSAEVRLAAVQGLWESTDPKLIRQISSLLRTDPEESVRAAAATTLGQFVLLGELGKLRDRYRDELRTTLIEVVDDQDESVTVRRRALEALGPINHELVTMMVESAYESDEEEMQLSAIFAMGRSADERWMPILELEANSERPENRYESAVALGEMDDPGATQLLIRMIDDPDRVVLLAAIASLGKVGGRDAQRALRRLQQHPDEVLRVAAEEALNEIEFLDAPFDGPADTRIRPNPN
jgi:HEAT repeat protein